MRFCRHLGHRLLLLWTSVGCSWKQTQNSCEEARERGKGDKEGERERGRGDKEGEKRERESEKERERKRERERKTRKA